MEIAKKMGKSELAAAVALLLTCGDGEERAEVYGCAADRQQATIVFDVAADMVRMCPALNKRVKILASQKRIIYTPTNSFYQVLSAEAYSKHGFNIHGVVFDELHTQPNRKLFDVMTKGSGDARMQPLYFLITTAGTDTNSICYETHQKAKDILEGRKIDPTFYPVIYGADESDDWTDPKVWKKSNPSLGITVGIDKVKAACESAKQNPGEENSFRQLRLNQWVKQAVRWMPMEKWDACSFAVNPDELEGRVCYGGLDLSSTTDIQKKPEWEFAGIYADDGISGTNTKKREDFNRMIDDCETGNIDMIITKSISRFARNTLDCLKYIRQLKDKNIPVFFEKEAINTMDAKGEVLITIMASLAQQESQSLSQNVKLGLQFRYQNGQVQVNHNHFLGYTKDANGNLIIDPEQAEVVKRIYREYLEGYSMDRIAKGLEADGILTGAGKTKWWTSTINKILRNEKYIGDALLQKTYTTDFLNKTRVKNNGIVPQYYVEGNHEAIIPKDIFLRVQEELVRRRVVKTSANGKKRSYSCNHCFAQIVICGECGEMFRRIHWNNRGCKSIVWRCISRLEPTGQECHARTVNETVLENVVVQAINTLLGDKSTYQAQLQQNIAKVIRSAQQNTTDGIDERLTGAPERASQKGNNKEAYDEIADEIFKLREQREKCTVDTAARDAQIARINELQDFIKQQPPHLEAFDEALVKRWLERIIVWEDHFTVELKSGLKIEIEG